MFDTIRYFWRAHRNAIENFIIVDNITDILKIAKFETSEDYLPDVIEDIIDELEDANNLIDDLSSNLSLAESTGVALCAAMIITNTALKNIVDTAALGRAPNGTVKKLARIAGEAFDITGDTGAFVLSFCEQQKASEDQKAAEAA